MRAWLRHALAVSVVLPLAAVLSFFPVMALFWGDDSYWSLVLMFGIVSLCVGFVTSRMKR